MSRSPCPHAPCSLPTGMLRSDRGAPQAGGGVLLSHSWGGVPGRGAAQAAGPRLRHSETEEPFPAQIIRDSGRKAAKTAARKYERPYPFTLHRFDTDGRTIFATLSQGEKRQRMVEDLAYGQFVFEKICRPFFKKLDYRQDDPKDNQDNPIRFWPLNKNGRVVLDPQRHFGKPIDAPTGVPTQALYLAVKAGEDQSTVATWFNVPYAAVAAAVKFEESLAV